MGDLLIQGRGQHDAGTQCVFACCAERESAVVELVLSMYARRARLPEPEEVLVCTEATSLEEVELLKRRFASARTHGRGENLYCVANVHSLSYAVQCGVVEALRKIGSSADGLRFATALVFVSGLADQMFAQCTR